MALEVVLRGAQSTGHIAFFIIGDGVSTSFSTNLAHPPFNLPFTTDGTTNNPTGFDVASSFGSGSGSLSNSTLTITFPSAPASGSNEECDVTFLFGGVS